MHEYLAISVVATSWPFATANLATSRLQKCLRASVSLWCVCFLVADLRPGEGLHGCDTALAGHFAAGCTVTDTSPMFELTPSSSLS
jgi:hypothetical protein